MIIDTEIPEKEGKGFDMEAMWNEAYHSMRMLGILLIALPFGLLIWAGIMALIVRALR